MPVFAFEAVAGRKFRAAFVILPNLIEPRLTRLGPQGALFQDGALLITINFEEPGFLVPVPAV